MLFAILFLLQMFRSAPVILPEKVNLPAHDDIGYDPVDSEALRKLDNTDTVPQEGMTKVGPFSFFWNFVWGAARNCIGNGSMYMDETELKDNFQIQLPHMTDPETCKKPTKADLFALLQEAIRIGSEQYLKYSMLKTAAESVVDAIAR